MLAFFKESLIGQYITVFIVSMVPLIELRGAIPIAHGFMEMVHTSASKTNQVERHRSLKTL